MKTVFIVALLLTSILLLGSMEVVEASRGCEGEAKYYNLNWRSSNGEQGTDCVELCFYEGWASLNTCTGPEGKFIAEDLTTDLQNYVGEIEDGPCHIQLLKYTLRDVLKIDCAMFSSNPGMLLWHGRGVRVDGCECLANTVDVP
jgi:hypothetical protein